MSQPLAQTSPTMYVHTLPHSQCEGIACRGASRGPARMGCTCGASAHYAVCWQPCLRCGGSRDLAHHCPSLVNLLWEQACEWLAEPAISNAPLHVPMNGVQDTCRQGRDGMSLCSSPCSIGLKGAHLSRQPIRVAWQPRVIALHTDHASLLQLLQLPSTHDMSGYTTCTRHAGPDSPA